MSGLLAVDQVSLFAEAGGHHPCGIIVYARRPYAVKSESVSLR